MAPPHASSGEEMSYEMRNEDHVVNLVYADDAGPGGGDAASSDGESVDEEQEPEVVEVVCPVDAMALKILAGTTQMKKHG
jgi:hypothetical protein